MQQIRRLKRQKKKKKRNEMVQITRERKKRSLRQELIYIIYCQGPPANLHLLSQIVQGIKVFLVAALYTCLIEFKAEHSAYILPPFPTIS